MPIPCKKRLPCLSESSASQNKETSDARIQDYRQNDTRSDAQKRNQDKPCTKRAQNASGRVDCIDVSDAPAELVGVAGIDFRHKWKTRTHEKSR